MCMRLCVHICNQRLQRNDKFLYSKEALRRSDYMLITSWYYDERSQEFKKTSLKELKRLEYDNKEEFLYIKERLYRSQNKSVPMILVRKGLNQGFRRKGNSTGNHTSKSRGECESLTHQGNKEALATVDELIIMFNDEKVKLFIKGVEVEKEIVCNGTTYEIDLFFELEKLNQQCTMINGMESFGLKFFIHVKLIQSKQKILLLRMRPYLSIKYRTSLILLIIFR